MRGLGQERAPEEGQTASSGSTRDRILDAAEQLFAERGFAGVPMRDLAARVGLNPASLYNHFKSKQALYDAVLERGLRPLFEVVDALEPSYWAPEQLDAGTDTIMVHLARQPHLPRILAREALSGGEHLVHLTNVLRPLFERALATFRDRHARGDRRLLSCWEESELPLLLLALHQLILGHFALAPMYGEVLGEDPLSPRSVERQRRFVRKVVRLMISGHAEDGAVRRELPGPGAEGEEGGRR